MTVYELMQDVKTGKIEGTCAPKFTLKKLRTKEELQPNMYWPVDVKKYKLVKGYGAKEVDVVAYI